MWALSVAASRLGQNLAEALALKIPGPVPETQVMLAFKIKLGRFKDKAVMSEVTTVSSFHL